ncbi:MAG: hypothetical protein AAFV53_37970 [Myxococcota bacterium]
MRISPLLPALLACLPACSSLEDDLDALTQRVSQLEEQLDDSEADQAAAEAELQEALDALAEGLASLEESEAGDSPDGRYLHECGGTESYEVDWGVTFTDDTLGEVTVWMYTNPEWLEHFLNQGGQTAIQYGWNSIEPDLTTSGGIYSRCEYDFIDFPGFRTEKFLLIID